MSWSHTLGAYLRTRPTSPPSTMTSLLWDTVIINVTEVDLMVVILQERREGKSSGWSETVGGPTGERTDISGDCEDRDFIFECENEMLTRLARGINNIGIESGACDWAMPKDTWSNVTFPPEVGPVIILIIATHTCDWLIGVFLALKWGGVKKITLYLSGNSDQWIFSTVTHRSRSVTEASSWWRLSGVWFRCRIASSLSLTMAP